VFFQNKLYSDAVLHVIYIGLQIYGWYNWTHHRTTQKSVIIELTPLKNILGWSLLCVFTTAAVGFTMHTYTDASFPYPDAFTTCASLIAQWLMTRRQIFNWVLWIIVDIVAIAIYLQKGLFPTSILYVCFLIMSCVGLYSWMREYNLQKETKMLDTQ